jgi:hypothetical protein
MITVTVTPPVTVIAARQFRGTATGTTWFTVTLSPFSDSDLQLLSALQYTSTRA